MMKRICISFLLFSVVSPLFAQMNTPKWGLSASLAPWIDNREITLSRSLSDMWTLLFWSDFTFEEEELAHDTYFTIDDGYKWQIGPEIRRKLYRCQKYNIAPYIGLLLVSGYEKYDMTAHYGQDYKKSHHSIDIGAELTFGVEYFLKEFLSISIHTRFFRYHYYNIDLDTYYPDKVNYKTGYHVVKAFNALPSAIVRFYF